jgi:hypothetical protein
MYARGAWRELRKNSDVLQRVGTPAADLQHCADAVAIGDDLHGRSLLSFMPFTGG